MKRFLPGSTGRQVALIVIGSISLAHLLFAGILMMFVPSSPERGLSARIALVVRMERSLPEPQRSAILAAASAPGFAISRTTDAPRADRTASLHSRLPETIRHELDLQSGDVVTETPDPAPGVSPHMRILVHTAPAEWLAFTVAPQPHEGPFGAYTFPVAVVLLLGLPLAAITLWAARRVTAPLARLAEATARMCPPGAEQPIPEGGTNEIRQVARAFNTILGRLQKFVADRTGMLAAISHDLRTPLTRMRLRAELLDDEVMRGKLLKDIRAMDVMITSTLAYITQERSTEKLENIDLAALLQTMSDDFSDAGFDVAYVGPLHCAAACRPQALERALNNLIENAIKFGEAATLVLDAASGTLVIDVEDDGPGIADAEKEDVLKPFYRSDSARSSEQGGVGLGLAIANTIVQRHGGTMALLDRQPHGLCVRVCIPR